MKKLLSALLLFLALPFSAEAQLATSRYRVDTIAALKAISLTRAPGIIADVTDPAIGGSFVWSGTVCSAADDVFQVAPTSGPAGCWNKLVNPYGLGPSIRIGSDGSDFWLGIGALGSKTGGSEKNTAFGQGSVLGANTTETYSTGVGYAALSLSTGHANTAFGAGAGGTISTGYDSVALGADALRNADNSGDVTGHNNVALGVHALGHVTSGLFNVAVGNYSMVGGGAYIGVPSALLTGSYNTGVGHFSLGGILGDANENVALGYNAGAANTTGDQNIYIGAYSGDSTTTGSLNILIGRDVQTTSVTASNELNIGNLIRASGLNQGGAVSTGNVGIGVPLNVNPSSPLHVYNTTQAGLLLDVGGNIAGAINQQTDGILNIIPDATGYLNVAGGMVVTSGLTAEATTFPGTFKSNTAAGGLLMYGANNSGPNFVQTILASRGTVASPTTIGNSDPIASLVYRGYDSNSYETAAQISIYTGGAVSNGIVPGYIDIATTNSSGVLTSALTIDAAQLLTAQVNMTVNGTLRANTGFNSNGSAGVSCPAGINASTFRSVNGIVTAC